MPTSRDLRRLIAILDDEGFGVLAGEILAEISAGRIVDRDEDRNLGSEKINVGKAAVISDDGSDDEPVRRVPIPREDQLDEAIGLLRIRLVEPARRLAEAERVAGEFMDGGPIRFEFVDNEGERYVRDVDREGDGERAEAGDDRVAKALDELLRYIVGDIELDTV